MRSCSASDPVTHTSNSPPISALIYSILLLGYSLTQLTAAPTKENKEVDWGLGVAYRVASTPYIGENDFIHGSVPLFFYEDGLFFIRGTYAGITPLKNEKWAFSLLGHMRFMDLPEELNDDKFDNFMFIGTQLQYKWKHNQSLDLEILTDSHGRFISNIRWSKLYANSTWYIKPHAQLQFLSKRMNSFYYGLDEEDLGEGIELSAGITGRYHLFKNIYAWAHASAKALSDESRRSRFVDKTYCTEFAIGLTLGDDPGHIQEKALNPYIQISQGWASNSRFLELMKFEFEDDPYNNQLTSIIYGIPLSDRILGLNVDAYLDVGLVHHWSNKVQGSSIEGILGFKFYYTLPLPWRVRFGMAEGISYISEPTFIEKSHFGDEDTKRWLNYLNASLDINLGDILGNTFGSLWLGIGIHHRSAMEGQAQQFGDHSAGSNYGTIYIQHER